MSSTQVSLAHKYTHIVRSIQPVTALTGSFACLFDCSLLARPLLFGPQRVGSPCSVVSLAQSTPLYLPNRPDAHRLCPLQIILA